MLLTDIRNGGVWSGSHQPELSRGCSDSNSDMGMRRAFLFALLVISVLFSGTLQARRGGGTFRGGAAGHSRFHDSRNSNATFVPLWYDVPAEYESPAFPVSSLESYKSQPAARKTPAANSQIIEVPNTANSAASKPLLPAMFVLRNGERLEARRYLLTYDNLSFTVEHQQRTIPLAMLDIKATVAANHERGINLRIPADRSEISVGFSGAALSRDLELLFSFLSYGEIPDLGAAMVGQSTATRSCAFISPLAARRSAA